MEERRPGRTVRTSITKAARDGLKHRVDEVATEEPLEIRVVAGDGSAPISVAITMRTPGNDFELAAGFLYTEGVVTDRDDLARIAYCTDADQPQQYNVISVSLRAGTQFDANRLSRHVYTTSSCGVCGKVSIDAVRAACPRLPRGVPARAPSFYWRLPEVLRETQTLFNRTGGMHATSLFDAGGRVVALREDVGRHNAMDKVIGALLLEGTLPTEDCVAVVSGRASFELVQKAAVAGISTLAAVGAPSSLAVELAREVGMTLIGFLRNDRLNVYAGAVTSE